MNTPKQKTATRKQKPWLKQTSLHDPLPTDLPKPLAVEPPQVRLLDRHEVCAIANASYPTVWAG